MESSYSCSVTASQVGSYFVRQYYQVLQQQPEFVHQFYTDSSTMIRVDGESTETASAIFIVSMSNWYSLYMSLILWYLFKFLILLVVLGYCKFGWSKYGSPSGRASTFMEFGNIESPVYSRLCHFFATIYSRMQENASSQPTVVSIPISQYDDRKSAKIAKRQLKEAI